MTGTVTLVGAGPGGKGLLTLAGAAALQNAEVVVYDRLVGEDVLAMIPDSAERVNVGKENRRHPVPQDEINELLVRYAKAGKRTVRLKGGDCYLFGRGGEECEFLRENSVKFRVIPGVTSALAAPAFAGIPVTHRDYASSVHIVTAHARAGKALAIDYESLVKMGGTLVFLMGLSAVETVCGGLLAAGLDPETPAAVVENGARANQRKVVATAAALAAKVREAGLQSPAVIIVGAVCALSETLDWFTPLPLHGKTIVVTRPKERAGTITEKLRDLGANVLECPCIETIPRGDASALRNALGFSYDWAVFTSPAGVHAAVHVLGKLGRDLRALYGMKLAAVGRGTAAALAEFGLTADLVPEKYDGAHLADALLKELPKDGAVLLLRAAQGGRELPERLLEADMIVADIPLYDTVCRTGNNDLLRARLAEGAIDAAAFTSASTVRGFAAAAGEKACAGLPAFCIGEKTAREAEMHGMRTKISKNATIDDLVACILEEIEHV